MHEMMRRIVDALRGGERVALASVVERRGSLPMASDACMLVHADGTAAGTIGGGCLEAEVYGVARRLLEAGGASLDRFNLTEVEDGLHGHVCGGSVGILTRALEPDATTLAVFAALVEAIERGTPSALASRLPGAAAGSDDGAVGCCYARQTLATGGPLPAPVVAAARGALRDRGDRRVAVEMDGDRWVVEPLPAQPQAVIFGAGHCGRAIGHLAAHVGFRVSMLEDRASFLDRETMPWAHELRQVDIADAADGLPTRDDLYFVIVTRGHEHDLTILRQLLGRPSAYLGMIGSERKRHLFARTLRAEGVEDEELAHLASPMGLAIGAETPEEIAVAVVAEMVAVRRGMVVDDLARSIRSSRRPTRMVSGG